MPMQILMEQMYHQMFGDDSPHISPKPKALKTVETQVSATPSEQQPISVALPQTQDPSVLQSENERLNDELLTSIKGKNQLQSEFNNLLSKVERVSKFNDKFYKLNISKTEFDELNRMVKNF